MRGVFEMNGIFGAVKYEFKQLYYSRTIIKFFIVYFIIIIVSTFIEIDYVNSTKEEYLNTKSFYIENNIKDESENDEFVYEYNDESGVSAVTNPLAYNYEQYNNSIYALSSRYLPQQNLEVSIITLPFIVFILGLFLSVRDIKNKTYRYTFLKYGKKSCYLAKLIALFIMILSLILFITVISEIISVVAYRSVVAENAEFYDKSFDPALTVPYIIKVAIMSIILLMYGSLGLLVGSIIHSLTIGSIISIVYIYIVPCFAKYDIKNCTYIIVKRYFDMIGVVNITDYKPGSVLPSILILIVVLVATNAISLYINCNRTLD